MKNISPLETLMSERDSSLNRTDALNVLPITPDAHLSGSIAESVVHVRHGKSVAIPIPSSSMINKRIIVIVAQ